MPNFDRDELRDIANTVVRLQKALEGEDLVTGLKALAAMMAGTVALAYSPQSREDVLQKIDAYVRAILKAHDATVND